MTDSIRVFVNSKSVDVPPGSSALDAVRASDPSAAAEIENGKRLITDSRGLPIDAATPMSAGSILRVIANRAASAEP